MQAVFPFVTLTLEMRSNLRPWLFSGKGRPYRSGWEDLAFGQTAIIPLISSMGVRLRLRNVSELANTQFSFRKAALVGKRRRLSGPVV